LTTLRVQTLVPVILSLAVVGAYTHAQRIGDVVLAFVFGVAGYYMKKHGWPRIPLVVALLLGAGVERNLHITARLFELGRLDLAGRPILFVLALLIALNLALPWWQASKQARRKAHHDRRDRAADRHRPSAGARRGRRRDERGPEPGRSLDAARRGGADARAAVPRSRG
jgi:putative tricarboxylic transport membrane protein